MALTVLYVPCSFDTGRVNLGEWKSSNAWRFSDVEKDALVPYLISFRKSTPPHDRQLSPDLSISTSNSKQ